MSSSTPSISLLLAARASADQYSNCTVTTCPISTSYWYYQPSIAANATLLSIFTLSLLSFLLTYLVAGDRGHHRRFPFFATALSLGTLLEILGYTGRLLAHSRLWSQPPFMLQIITLTIAPAFIAAGIYTCLARIIVHLGAGRSRLRPQLYTRFFISADVLSLVLQALGGGMASEAYHEGKSPRTGNHIMVAGLAWQVATLAAFIALSADFAIRTMRSRKADQARRLPFQFRAFVVALAIATFCIFVRSVYRVVELSEGWQGHLIRQQWLFLGLEGVMVAIAVLVLNIAHPAFSFQEVADKEVEETKVIA